MNPDTPAEVRKERAKQALYTLFQLSEGFERDINRVANAVTDPTDGSMIRGVLLPDLEGIDFLLCILQEALECGSDGVSYDAPADTPLQS